MIPLAAQEGLALVASRSGVLYLLGLAIAKAPVTE